jgi:hypothetical protein
LALTQPPASKRARASSSAHGPAEASHERAPKPPDVPRTTIEQLIFGSRTPDGNEFQQQPDTQTSLKEVTLKLFEDLLQDTPIPDEWLADLDIATSRDYIFTSACDKALGLGQHLLSDPAGVLAEFSSVTLLISLKSCAKFKASNSIL